MAIEDWMPTLAHKVSEIGGLLQVHTYDDMPASLLVFPCAVILPRAGRVDYALQKQTEEHDVQITVFTAGQVLPEAQGQAVPFVRLMRNKLAANMKLDGAPGVDKILPRPGADWYEGPGGIEYATKIHTGIIFRYTVFARETESVETIYTVSA